MNQTRAIIAALKQVLRQRRITYATVASELALSEASVKRMFSNQSFSLKRLEQICSLAGMPMSELVNLAEQRPAAVSLLTPEQEHELVADPKLLLVAYMTLNHWHVADIVAAYQIDEHEVVRRLAKLDRLGMIELLPGNRVRRLVARNFSWRRNGPVQTYFEREVKRDFLASRFAASNEHLCFVGGLLSSQSIHRMHQEIDRLTAQLDEFIQDDAALPMEEKTGVAAVLAIRPWEVPAFRRMRRPDPA